MINQRKIFCEVAYEGDCKNGFELNTTPVSEVTTENGSEVDTSSPEDYYFDSNYGEIGEGCSLDCEGVPYKPVCGDDMVTYDNLCQMQENSQIIISLN